MDPLDRYVELANAFSLIGFEAKLARMFLLKRPDKRTGHSVPARAQFSFHTSHATEVSDPYPEEYRVSPIAKNPDNPFPDRMTVGRAPNCDVVVRMPSVSKVHAHLAYTQRGTLTLSHAKSSNTTRHNGRLVSPEATVEVQPGDIVSLGTLDLEVLTVEALYELARARGSGS